MEKLSHSAYQWLYPLFWKTKILFIEGTASLAFVVINLHILHPHILQLFLTCLKYYFIVYVYQLQLRKIFLSLPFVLPAPWFNWPCLIITIPITSLKQILYWFVTFRNKLVNILGYWHFVPVLHLYNCCGTCCYMCFLSYFVRSLFPMYLYSFVFCFLMLAL